MIFRVDKNVADIRIKPLFRSERISQVLFNEDVEASDEKEGYIKVRCPDALEGWIDKRFLVKSDKNSDTIPRLVVSNLASAYEKPDTTSKRLTSIPYGCKLYGKTENEFLGIQSGRYGTIFIHDFDLSDDKPLPLTPESLIDEAEKFMGAPYLWGGRSFFGIDCSGFAQCILGRFGVKLPRDSKDQRLEGKEIARNNIAPGDLLFFPGHVTIAVSSDLMIHSSLGNGGVAYNSLNKNHPQYSQYYDDNLQTIRRVLP